MIYETIITTINATGEPHITPFGVQYDDHGVLVSPFKPSTTLENILRSRVAVMSVTDDVRVFAGTLTGRRQFPLVKADVLNGFRLANSLAHQELELLKVDDDEIRPRLHMRVVHQAQHAPFQGFNRAQAAVVELAVLTSRLDRLSKDKVLNEKAYLQIAIDKTAGDRERVAWQWLSEKIDGYYAGLQQGVAND